MCVCVSVYISSTHIHVWISRYICMHMNIHPDEY